MTIKKCYTYVLDHDNGLAPNPFFDYLTLALCKPPLYGTEGPRKWIKEDWLKDGEIWIFANAGIKLYLEDYQYHNDELQLIKGTWKPHNRLVFAFRVNEILTFNSYYNDNRFKYKKKAITDKNPIKMYGDNRYFSKEDSLYECFDDECSSKVEKVENVVPCDKVLISDKNDFYYFGCFAPNILENFNAHFLEAHGSKVIKNSEDALKLIKKIKEICPKSGIFGFPSFKENNCYFSDVNYLRKIYEDCIGKEIKPQLRKLVDKKYEFKNPNLGKMLNNLIN